MIAYTQMLTRVYGLKDETFLGGDPTQRLFGEWQRRSVSLCVLVRPLPKETCFYKHREGEMSPDFSLKQHVDSPASVPKCRKRGLIMHNNSKKRKWRDAMHQLYSFNPVKINNV